MLIMNEAVVRALSAAVAASSNLAFKRAAG
jgi:hypothetical protein